MKSERSIGLRFAQRCVTITAFTQLSVAIIFGTYAYINMREAKRLGRDAQREEDDEYLKVTREAYLRGVKSVRRPEPEKGGPEKPAGE